MSDERQENEKGAGSHVIPAAQRTDAPGSPDVPPGAQPKDVKPLTPEEQMALYEEKLKEEDWGHQPC